MEENTQLTMDLGQYTQAKEEIKNDLAGIVKSFVRVGWQLWRINASEAYKMAIQRSRNLPKPNME